jgi:DNA helicase HerA-like ATPase
MTALPNDRPGHIGVVTHGSLTGGIEMKLASGQEVEEVVAGTFAVVQGATHDFFCLITDVTIDAANEQILLYPPGPDEVLLRRVMQGMSTYATVALKPMLMLPNAGLQDLTDDDPRPVKTVPAHFSPVAQATRGDVGRVFGSAENDPRRFFDIGTPLGMSDVPVCIDLPRLAERSSAVFGKTGTGKTFVTRLLMAGWIHTRTAVNLVFDMHSEYGSSARAEGGANVKGLKQLFPSQVRIVSLDPEGTKRRGARADIEAYLYADQIEPEDILPLQSTLNLNDTAAESTHLLRRKYGTRWLARLLEAEGEGEMEEIAEATNAHPSALSALQRRLRRFERHGFFSTDSSAGKVDVVDEIVSRLEEGKSIIFEFGRYSSLDVYLLVSNVITRRIRRTWEEKAERYLQSQHEGDRPHQLVITIEEAHKLLASGIARETPFGKIAREMRKYFVSLLIVDQRPSAIDDEVLSQIGTKFVAQLSDDKDIAAALVGTSGAGGLRSILASLESKQQALVLGHALPMPLVVRTRSYDDAFYTSLGHTDLDTLSDADLEAEAEAWFG